MAKIKLAVIFGGCSSEHNISLESASSVIKNLDKNKYDIIPIGITKKGRWMFFPGDINDIELAKWEKSEDNVPCIISPDKSSASIIKFLEDGTYALQKIDVILPVLHGKNGEDGTIQGLFTLAGIPYVGCDTLSSAVCMDKAMTHAILEQAGIKTAKYEVITRSDMSDIEALEARLAQNLSYPLFVKPANAGSSVGVNQVTSKEYLNDAINIALAHDSKVIAENQVIGSEIECAVMGNDNPVASVLGEIIPCNDFYDYEAKYIHGSSKLIIPAEIEKSVSQKVRETAIKAYKALGCTGLSRVDFFVSKETSEIIVNEVNTIPGFTSISMYPKLFAASGIEYKDLLDSLIELAIERADHMR